MEEDGMDKSQIDGLEAAMVARYMGGTDGNGTGWLVYSSPSHIAAALVTVAIQHGWAPKA